MSTTGTLFSLPIERAAVEFFYEHAGFSYDPKMQTMDEGRRECARNLAEAEAYAKAHGWTAEWDRDADAEYAETEPEWAEWPQYVCDIVDTDGEFLGSLGGVMFRDKGDETMDPYARVVEAELFAEAMGDHLARLEQEASRR